ncbi:MAG: hypothetical protein J6J87_04025 [Oscillospiraceae bacterium]|nr:hypothetical protein [Oscillospiraceae bacterium]
MERRNQNILIGLIAIVIVIAVFSSFGLSLFTSPTPTITLPTPLPTATESSGDISQEEGKRVEITPATVQSTIEALNRTESYYRTVTTTLAGRETYAEVWADRTWTRSKLTLSSGITVNTIVGDGQVWRWYGDEDDVASWQADETSVDVEGQRIPTYEDVLALDPRSITAAGYEERDGYLCVFVEIDVPELDQRERYWVSADSGLLAAAETEHNGEVVWSMTTSVPEIPVPRSASFELPDGTVLHQTGDFETFTERASVQG